jgi:hypothetical protein
VQVGKEPAGSSQLMHWRSVRPDKVTTGTRCFPHFWQCVIRSMRFPPVFFTPELGTAIFVPFGHFGRGTEARPDYLWFLTTTWSFNLELQTGVTSAGRAAPIYRHGKDFPLGLSSMIDTATVLLLGLFSVSIFLAHALDAYNAK